MKNISLLILLSILNTLFAQSNEIEYIETPSLVFKVAPRILSPRMGVEKVIDNKSSVNFEGRFYAFWIPQGGRIEAGYRRYFNPTAPFGGYFNVKGGIGYFTYQFFDDNTQGIQAGGGFSFGGQFNIGSKNAIIDVFGGIQIIAPFYLNIDNRNLQTFEYNIIHYTLIAFPLEFGMRFGFFNTIKTPNYEIERNIKNDYPY